MFRTIIQTTNREDVAIDENKAPPAGPFFAALVLAFSSAFQLEGSIKAAEEDFLEEGFRNPQKNARPFVYWYWINQNISKEGITTDLEAMKRAGIGGALLIQAGLPPTGNVPFMSPQYIDIIGHALKEARRLGLEISINNADAWGGNGGPWIKPEQSMKEVTWSLTRLTSANTKKITLPKPFNRYNFYRDIAVVALPMSEVEWRSLQNKPVITSNRGAIKPDALTDDDPHTAETVSPAGDKPLIFDFKFEEPFTARSFTIGYSTLIYRALPETGILQVSEDGKIYKDFQTMVLGRRTHLPITTVSFNPVTSKYFRLYIPPYHANSDLKVSALSFHAAQKINYWQAKAGYSIKAAQHEGDREYLYAKNDAFAPSAASFIPVDSVIVLTDKLDKNGNLNWKAPKGRWNILRIGYTTTGQENAPATPVGLGLECDKLNPIGIETHFPHVLGRFLELYPEYNPDTFFGTHTDSWEYDNQNWTEILQEEFQNRRKYDLLPYLAALAGGYQIGSKEATERFLHDFRVTLSELIKENYFDRFRELCHKNGLVLSGEGSGGDQYMYQGFSYQSALDIPMGEFWVNADVIYPENKAAASVSHILNKPLVAAESFTSSAPHAKYLSYPYTLKSLGDRAFTSGVNWLWFHTFVHQPRPDIKPGLTLGGWGTHFEHTNTWFNQSKAWIDYLSRCQFMLQQGRFNADVLYLMSEDIPSTVKTKEQLGIPAGYDYDVCDRNIILHHIDVKDGKFVTKTGMEYSLLILPDEQRMSLELLKKIAELVKKGGRVTGPKILSTNGLTHYPAPDAEVQKIAAELWGSTSEVAKVNAYGKGKVYAGVPVEKILAELQPRPDFTHTLPNEETLSFIHRRHEDTDFYFVANKNYEEVETECTFRVKNKMPEIWYPDKGVIQKNIIFKETEEGITVPLHFDPAGSYFIVFRDKIPAKYVRGVQAGNKPVYNNQVTIQASGRGKFSVTPSDNQALTVQYSDGSVAKVKKPALPAPLKIEGKWQVKFPPNLGAPEQVVLDSLYSLHLHEQEGVKHFSGTATYTKAFDLPAKGVKKNHQLALNLGEVAVIATVKVNRQEAATLWKKPFTVDVTKLVKPGKNTLEITVANLWTNRLIGDEKYPDPEKYESWGPLLEIPEWYQQGKPRPETKRVGFVTTMMFIQKDSLVASGLIGPVTLKWHQASKL